MMRDAGAIPTFIGYKPHGMIPFPFAICASVNERVVHGFSDDIPLKEGDILSIDMAATYNGFVGDTATTIPVGEISDELKQFIRVTEECLDLAIQECCPNNRVGDLARRFRNTLKNLVMELCAIIQDTESGEVCTNLRKFRITEDAEQRKKFVPDFVFAIEPMLNLGTHETKTLDDKWTVVTKDGKASAHAEHTVAITAEGPEILTLTKEQKAKLKTIKNRKCFGLT